MSNVESHDLDCCELQRPLRRTDSPRRHSIPRETVWSALSRCHSFVRSHNDSSLTKFGMSSTERPPLQRLLSKAVRAPNCIHTDDGGAVLALSLHCKLLMNLCRASSGACTPALWRDRCSIVGYVGLFIEAGFTNNLKRGKPYPPQKDWNRNRDAWIFQYTKCGRVTSKP